jgi:hypothetical protein
MRIESGIYASVSGSRATLSPWIDGSSPNSSIYFATSRSQLRVSSAASGPSSSVQQAAASRARRTSAILSGLTALTVVTVAVALIGNFLGTRSDAVGHLWLRVAISPEPLRSPEPYTARHIGSAPELDNRRSEPVGVGR